MSRVECGRTGFDGPCDDPSCACHAEFWDEAALAFAGPRVATLPGGQVATSRSAAEIARLADELVSWRAARVTRAKRLALEQKARKDHPSKAWDD